MRFVAVKGEEQQASVVVFRARDLLVQQRTQTINALRGHLAEYGLVVSKGPSHIAKLIALEDPQSSLPQAARLARSLYWSKRCGRWSTASSGLMSRLHVVPGKTELLGGWQRSPALVRSQQRRWSRCRPHQPLSRRPRLCHLARINPTAALDRRQAEARRDIEDGRANAAAPAHHRRGCLGATESTPKPFFIA